MSEEKKHRHLFVDREPVGGWSTDASLRREGHVPLFLHPKPRRVLVLGVGTGIPLSAVLAHGVERVDAVEPVAGVLEVARRQFGPWSAFALENPRVEAIVGDPAREVRTRTVRYDVVIGDRYQPGGGAIALCTREHLASVRALLAPGGIHCQWLPLTGGSGAGLRTAVRTFLDVFPDAHAVFDRFGPDVLLGLVGGTGPLAFQMDAFQRLARDGARQHELGGLRQPADLLGLYAGGSAALRAFAGPGPLLTRDRPGPRREMRDAGSEALDALLDLDPGLVPAIPPGPAVERDARRGRTNLLVQRALRRGALTEALERAAAVASPDYRVGIESLTGVGWAALKRDPAVAEAAFRSVLAVISDDPEALAGLGRALEAQGRKAEAAEAFAAGRAVRIP